MKNLTAHDVANVFVKLADTDSGDVLTNLKVQKLVYYVQGFHLALYNSSLFEDNIIAWEHGPVVEKLYHELKSFKSKPISISDPISDLLTEEKLSLIGEVNDVYGQFSAWKLRDMTHNEPPWQTTIKNKVITHQKLKSYFKTQLE